MRALAAALAAAGVCALAACTPAAAPSTTPGSAVPATASGRSTLAAPAPATPSADGTTPAAATSEPPRLIVLSGTSIGGRPLGYAAVGTIDPMLVERLGTAKVGQPRLCESDGARTSMAVIEHSWPGLTVRYGSTGAAATAVAWTVDLDRVPDGFQLADGLPWKTTFAALRKIPGITTSTTGGVATAQLSRQRIRYSGAAGSVAPDTVSGGAAITCG